MSKKFACACVCFGTFNHIWNACLTFTHTCMSSCSPICQTQWIQYTDTNGICSAILTVLTFFYWFSLFRWWYRGREQRAEIPRHQNWKLPENFRNKKKTRIASTNKEKIHSNRLADKHTSNTPMNRQNSIRWIDRRDSHYNRFIHSNLNKYMPTVSNNTERSQKTTKKKKRSWTRKKNTLSASVNERAENCWRMSKREQIKHIKFTLKEKKIDDDNHDQKSTKK